MTDIKSALSDLFNDQSTPLAEAIDRHFSPAYRQRTNGAWDDRDGFTAHVDHLRQVVESMDIEVIDELADGNHYADRHIVAIHKRDGQRIVQEVYLFGERDTDGRFTRIEETTLMLSGTEADRDIGSAKATNPAD